MTTPLFAAAGAVFVGAGLVTIAIAFLAPATVTTPGSKSIAATAVSVIDTYRERQ